MTKVWANADLTVLLEEKPTPFTDTLLYVFRLFSNNAGLYALFFFIGIAMSIYRFRDRAIVILIFPVITMYLISITGKLVQQAFWPRRLVFLLPIEMFFIAVGIVGFCAIVVGILAFLASLATSLVKSTPIRVFAVRARFPALGVTVGQIHSRVLITVLSLWILLTQFAWPVLPGLVNQPRVPKIQDWRGASFFVTAAAQPEDGVVLLNMLPGYWTFYYKEQKTRVVPLSDQSDTTIRNALAAPGDKWLVKVDYQNPYESEFFKRAVPDGIVIPFTSLWVLYAPGRPLSRDEWSATRLRLLQIAVDVNPIGYEARVELGRVYRELGESERALSLLKSAIALHPANAPLAGHDYQANRHLALLYRSQGRLDLALQEFRTVRGVYPDSARAYIDEADVLLELGRVTEAEAIIRQGLRSGLSSPDTAWAYFHLGRIQEAMGDSVATLESWRQAIAMFPDGPPAELAHNSIGDRFLAAGDVARAADEYEKALGINPSSARAHTGMGDVYLARQDLGSARKAYERAIAGDARAAPALKGLGNVYTRLGEHVLALDAYQRALAVAPESDVGWYQVALGDFLRAQGRLADAAPVYEQATRSRPRLSPAFVGLSETYRALGRYEEAQAAYLDGLKLDPKSVWAYTGLGNIYLQVGRVDNAVAAFQEALGIDAKNVDAYLGLGTSLQQQGNSQAAIGAFEQALALGTRSTWAYLVVADAHRDRGDLTRAEELYRQALASDDSVPWTYIRLAEIARLRGQRADARVWYSRALERDPNNVYALRGLAMLK